MQGQNIKVQEIQNVLTEVLIGKKIRVWRSKNEIQRNPSIPSYCYHEKFISEWECVDLKIEDVIIKDKANYEMKLILDGGDHIGELLHLKLSAKLFFVE